ncbi:MULTISPECIES: hypothetical protein [Enterococcus]|jgi:hypothetical protein|uniref:Uncharacterized protein n=1 Tax=Enterococcus dongliensis TaxID=2559925 RepID=A0ABU3ES98_9ENTE|nr:MULTISPECIES: hypothetical protein [Enterococcus]AXG40773.1 hypothetical protein EGCR1_18830 [Enterococcus gilvus]MDT2597731.1 hypothetical protein [Enterococcus dongliensis]
MFKRKEPIHWVEVNVKIVKSVLSSNSWGTEVAHAQNKSQRRVRITVEIPLKEKRVVMATKKFWTFTKNRNIFQEGNFVTILYNQENPKEFKLKYDI